MKREVVLVFFKLHVLALQLAKCAGRIAADNYLQGVLVCQQLLTK